MKRPSVGSVILAGSLALAGTSGFFAAQALGVGQATETVTINVATGPVGPIGPPGPVGPKGEQGLPGILLCPAGFAAGVLVINHPGGQTSIYTCLK